MGAWWGEQKKEDVLQGYFRYLKRFKSHGSEVLNEDYDLIRTHLLNLGVTKLKDTFVLSIKKELLTLNFYYPCFLSNSPFDLDREVFVLLNSDRKLKNHKLEHFYSIYAHRNQHDQEYK